MKKLQSVKTTTYSAKYGAFTFNVDIVEKHGYREAFLYVHNYGVKDMMFGTSKEQDTEEEFLSLVEANLATYADDYIIEHVFNHIRLLDLVNTIKQSDDPDSNIVLYRDGFIVASARNMYTGAFSAYMGDVVHSVKAVNGDIYIMIA